jgi:hypothetical protein
MTLEISQSWKDNLICQVDFNPEYLSVNTSTTANKHILLRGTQVLFIFKYGCKELM